MRELPATTAGAYFESDAPWMIDRPEPVMRLPSGAEGRGQQGCCGIVAIAACADVTYDEVWALMSKGRRGNWKGSLNLGQILAALKHYGVQFKPAPVKGKMTLEQWTVLYSKRGVTYLVFTTGHVQTVRDGKILDQSTEEATPFHDYWGRRKRVNFVYELTDPEV